METAARLRLAMKAKTIDIDDMIKQTGIKKIYLSAYIDGRLIPRWQHPTKIAKYLKISEDWLMCRDNDVPLEVALFQGENNNLTTKEWENIIKHAKLLEGKYEEE